MRFAGGQLSSPQPSSPLWGGDGGGGVGDNLSGAGADTPTLALPTRGRGKKAQFRARDSLPSASLRPGMTLRHQYSVIPGEPKAREGDP